MKWFRVALFVCVVAVLQAGLVNMISVTQQHIRPDLLLVLMVFFAVSLNARDAIITSFAIGFVADVIATGQPMGPRTISLGLTGTFLSYVHNVFIIRKIFHQAVAVFFSGLLASAVSNFLTSLAGHSPVSGAYIVVLGTSLYSSFISPFLLLPSCWLMRIKTNRLTRQ